tara:strand:+ start:313 stop:567 length:255 start_codon:yes stop_codon:yes gene_type:complete
MLLAWSGKWGKVLEDDRHRTFMLLAASYTVGSKRTLDRLLYIHPAGNSSQAGTEPYWLLVTQSSYCGAARRRRHSLQRCDRGVN